MRSLPVEEQMLLREMQREEVERLSQSSENVSQSLATKKSYVIEYRWLNERRIEYAGQSVALDRDRLVSHGDDVRQVHALARAAGVEFP
jgi:hypothetical protein